MLSAKSIAVIDDEADLGYLFKEALEQDGYKVSVFTDSIEALNKLRQNLQDYAIIISDYRMPKMTGNELCKKLKNLNPDLKIIIITAYNNIECDTSRFILLHKPITIVQLLQIVRDNFSVNN